VIGEVVNNYRVQSLLGEGGMGSVYLAQHPFMGRKAAIKVLRREFAGDVGLVERFMNEARAANAIRHPNIIEIIDVGRMPSGVPYLMMEFLEGESLARRIEAAGKLAVTEAIDIAMQTAAALAAAHGKGIVHRDLKPDNLYLVPDEASATGTRVKVLDFGIAKLRGELSGGAQKTQSGSLMGTPPYMSPEQCRGLSDEIDHRTDIYALGIILYEMLCGAPPFVSAGLGEVVMAHLTRAPAPPRAKNREISEALEAVILKALEKGRDDRYATMGDMRAALKQTSSVGTFPPGRTAAAAAVAGAPAGRTTTLRSATGQMLPAPVIGGGDVAAPDANPAPRRRRGPALFGAAVLAAAAVAALFVVSRGKPPADAQSAAATTAPVAAVVPATPLPPAPAPEAPAAEVEAPPPAQVLVRIGSEPPGALVTDARRGVVIGATPFEQRRERGAASLGLRIAKDGYAPAEIEVPLGADFDRTVRLERQRAHTLKRDLAAAEKPAKAPPMPTAAPPPAAVPAPPAVAQPAAAPAATVPAKRRTEKW
jgi:serine/threonine-protein kinase